MTGKPCSRPEPWYVQEWHERRENVIDHTRMEVVERVPNAHSGEGSIAERYVRGVLEIHVHRSVRIGGPDQIARNFCTRFQRSASLAVVDDVEIAPAEARAEAGLDAGKNDPVAVNSGQIVELPKPVPVVLRVEEARLHRLDDVLGIGMNRADEVPLCIRRHGAVAVDREGATLQDVAGGVGGICHDQIRNQVVERGPEVLQGIPDDGGQLPGYLPEGYDPLAGLVVDLADEQIGCVMPSDGNSVTERLYVFVRPVELDLVTTPRYPSHMRELRTHRPSTAGKANHPMRDQAAG